MKVLYLFLLTVLFTMSRVQAESCILGSENIIQQTSVSTMPGLYLDTIHPVTCQGQLTQWQLCHYRIVTFWQRQYQAVLQVWRNESIGQYTLIGASMQTATITRSDEEFMCINYSLIQSEYIPVLQGDIVGVYLEPRSRDNSALTAVGTANSEEFLLYTDQASSSDSMLQLSGLSRMDGVRMHISVSIEVEDPSTTVTTYLPQTTSTFELIFRTEVEDPTAIATILPYQTTVSSDSEPSVPVPSQGGQAGQSDSGGLSGGAVAGIVIVILFLVAIGVAVGVVLLVIFYKRKNSFNFKSSGYNTGNNFSMSNFLYEAPIQTRSNTVILGQLDKGLDKRNDSSYEIPISKNSGRYQVIAVSERRSQDSIYVAMEGVESIPTKSAGSGMIESKYPSEVEPNLYQAPDEYQEPDGIAYHDSFEVAEDFDEDYAEMTSPEKQDPQRRRINIYASFGPKDFNYCDYMKRVSQNNENSVSWPYNTNNDPYCDPPEDEDLIIKELSEKTRTITKNAIKLMEVMVTGEFIDVHKGAWKGRNSDLDIVVKTLKSNAPQEEKIKLLQEAIIMGQFHHPNILQFYGVVNEDVTIMVVTEHTAKGSLLSTIKSINPDPGQIVSSDIPPLLLSYSQQVALGMHYLASKNFVHRDLEAKNIFVSCDNICKIGELTLSRELSDTEYYVSQGGEIPVAWMAPEAICYSKYSIASDVWSYGCLLYEIWSLGKAPFDNLPGEEINEKLQAGERLPPPPGCPKRVYNLMMQCWNPVPSLRPNFHDILNSLIEDEQKTLEVPHEDASVHKQASMLGGPLTAGENMYKTLQRSYTNNRFSIVNGEILYESIDQYQPFTSSMSDKEATLASSYNYSAQQSPPQNEPLNTVDADDIYDDIYDDIANCTMDHDFTEASTYEVPEQVQGSRKPPLPAGPPPPLHFDDANDTDYEEI